MSSKRYVLREMIASLERLANSQRSKEEHYTVNSEVERALRKLTVDDLQILQTWLAHCPALCHINEDLILDAMELKKLKKECADLNAEEIALIAERRSVVAVKAYRERTGATLYEGYFVVKAEREKQDGRKEWMNANAKKEG